MLIQNNTKALGLKITLMPKALALVLINANANSNTTPLFRNQFYPFRNSALQFLSAPRLVHVTRHFADQVFLSIFLTEIRQIYYRKLFFLDSYEFYIFSYRNYNVGIKKWALNPCFQLVNEEFCLKNCWKKYHFMSNSILFNLACLSVALFSKDNLCTYIQFSVCFIILDTEKTNIDRKKLILNMFKTWSFFDKKLRNSVTKNVTALRKFLAFSISTKKT